jgi:hypothetical protein
MNSRQLGHNWMRKNQSNEVYLSELHKFHIQNALFFISTHFKKETDVESIRAITSQYWDSINHSKKSIESVQFRRYPLKIIECEISLHFFSVANDKGTCIDPLCLTNGLFIGAQSDLAILSETRSQSAHLYECSIVRHRLTLRRKISLVPGNPFPSSESASCKTCIEDLSRQFKKNNQTKLQHGRPHQLVNWKSELCEISRPRNPIIPKLTCCSSIRSTRIELYLF